MKARVDMLGTVLPAPARVETARRGYTEGADLLGIFYQSHSQRAPTSAPGPFLSYVPPA